MKKDGKLLFKVLNVVGFVLLLSVFCLGFSPLYMHFVFGHVEPEALVTQLMTDNSGTPLIYYFKFFFLTFLPALLFTVFVYFFLPQLIKKHGVKLSVRTHRALVSVIVVCLSFAALVFAEHYTGVGRFLIKGLEESHFIQDNYVDTKNVSLKFPEKKRNLIYIWSESMESSFQDVASGGAMSENLIPELTKLATENYSFSSNAKIGGYYPVTTATFTLGSMVTQMGAIPYIVPFRKPNDTPEGDFIPGMWNLGDILEEQGYNNVFFSGSSANFGKQKNLFIQHGNYEVKDINYLKKVGSVPEDYHKFWGIEDYKLFNFAKKCLKELAADDKPFNFQIELMDTHGPEGLPTQGYTSKKYERQYDNVIVGASKMIDEFITWIKAQDWAENTTIVLVGDHFTMAPDYHENYVDRSQAAVYNCIINPLLSDVTKANVRLKNRKATTLDMLPTVLAALGVEIEGERLGMGTNLFSDADTLAERVGLETINEAFRRRSPFYEQKFLSAEWLQRKK